MMYLGDFDDYVNVTTDHDHRLTWWKFKYYANGVGAIYPTYAESYDVFYCPGAATFSGGTPLNPASGGFTQFETTEHCQADYVQPNTWPKHPDISKNPDTEPVWWNVGYGWSRSRLPKNVRLGVAMLWDEDASSRFKHELRGVNAIYWDMSAVWTGPQPFKDYYMTTFYNQVIQKQRAGTATWQFQNYLRKAHE
jgi:hypothetical protein